MSTLKQLEDAIQNLNREDRHKLHAWFENKFADEWDDRIHKDIAEGKLNWLAEEAKQAKHDGLLTNR